MKRIWCVISLLLVICMIIPVISSCHGIIPSADNDTVTQNSTESNTEAESEKPNTEEENKKTEKIIKTFQIAYKVFDQQSDGTTSFETWLSNLTSTAAKEDYETAVEFGFDGTLSEWHDTLLDSDILLISKTSTTPYTDTYVINFADSTSIQVVIETNHLQKGKFPALTYLYNTSDSHKVIAEYLQTALADVGITMNLDNREWDTFLDARYNGDFSIARNGWISDYNDPICFLELWTSNSFGNDAQLGKGAHAKLKMYDLDLTKWGYGVKVEDGTWAETYDVLIATIKSCTDTAKRYEMMHLAEDILMDTGCIVPLYFYTDIYMIDDKLEGFYSNPLGYKYFMNTTFEGKNSIDICLAAEPYTLDPALYYEVDCATMISNLFSGLAKWAQDEEGNLVIEADLAKELTKGVVNADGSVTYTYTLKDGLKWSNGDALTAEHVVNSWKRAASSELYADYGYMFEVIKGYGEDAWGNGKGETLAVEATDNKTIVVTLTEDVPYWNELLAFPTYYPIHPSAHYNKSWATDPSTYISNGAYKMTAWKHGNLITLEKNEYYHDADSVTMPKINCHLSNNTNAMLNKFKNGNWVLIDDVPYYEIENLKKNYPNEFVVAGQMGTYYACWNVNENILPAESKLEGVEAEKAQAEIRKAIGLLFDRNYIVEEIAQGGQVPASSFVAMGMTNPDGTEFYKTANSTTDNFDGYYDVSAEAFEANVAAAMEVLNKYYVIEAK